MAVLYRKYRPQTFSEVLGHGHIIQTLKNQVASGQVAHAYLFTGVRGTGKTSVARLLAKAVNCTSQKSGQPCGKCENCKAIAAGNFLDLIEIDAASNTGVDNIRDLIEHVRFAPSTGAYKVFIIDEVHMLSKGAFNALLKTLEEPPAHAIFVLATTEIHKVPATIISRTQRFDFKRFSHEELKGHLAEIAKKEKLKIEPEVLELVAENAEGSARDALSLLDKLLTLGDNLSLEESRQLLGVTDLATCERMLELLGQGQAAAVPAFISKISEKGLDAAIFSKDFLEYLRKCLVWKITGAAALDATHQHRLQEVASGFSLTDLMFVIRLFLKAYKEIPEAPDPEIPLLLAAVEAALKKGGEPAGRASATAQPQEAPTPAPAPADPKPKKPAVSKVAAELLVSETAAEAYHTDVSLEAVRLFWPRVVEVLKPINGPLANLLKNSPLVDVRHGRCVVAVKYAFHKQNLENPKNASLITDCIFKAGSVRIGLVAEVGKLEQEEKMPAAEALSEALKVFGGELIE